MAGGKPTAEWSAADELMHRSASSLSDVRHGAGAVWLARGVAVNKSGHEGALRLGRYGGDLFIPYISISLYPLFLPYISPLSPSISGALRLGEELSPTDRMKTKAARALMLASAEMVDNEIPYPDPRPSPNPSYISPISRLYLAPPGGQRDRAYAR